MINKQHFHKSYIYVKHLPTYITTDQVQKQYRYTILQQISTETENQHNLELKSKRLDGCKSGSQSPL